MYQYIIGVLKEVEPQHITVESNGIGYLLMVPNPFRFEHENGQQIQIYTELIVREDSHTLYGFKNRDEKTLFKSLLQVTGIGPKSALAILAAATPAEIIGAIEAEDEKFMQKFPGVGKKTASQIILDLKGKLGSVDIAAHPPVQDDNSHFINEAMLALEALGYSSRELKRIEKHLGKESFESVDAAVKRGLKYLVQ
ncbi:Holliday junction branch migration protein RuvA [Salinicoccus hispanicus]|uniref:Holliday junction branch migration complex subunit RuvA n=1 Tax=Salinicoccus hispanicus TaxID=157225 RepID=A0A6N8U2Y7_9STAP|nr:Holliday junction branch migration protein RuvA [Salinicoccus hispanicus]MXQ50029.1 Holliday junction branch migration protein RuvA [Salinicoccus hispanicus]